ncbi:hypothetical protein EYF80_047397 [Liparis tanakae]|uniref:Uncharacterized protein n=1 Tax=Liparis tanakae TaxID=230148 RepID=A0A4Z2FMQ8_9TELE|nr:hypothetical protein EYF80_047397 [Liparis tanakae]
MTSVSCTRRSALRASPVRALLFWTSVWSCVARRWTAVCMRPRLHSSTPRVPSQPSSARPQGAAAAGDHGPPPDAEQQPSSIAARPTSPATSLGEDGQERVLIGAAINRKYCTVFVSLPFVWQLPSL